MLTEAGKTANKKIDTWYATRRPLFMWCLKSTEIKWKMWPIYKVQRNLYDEVFAQERMRGEKKLELIWSLCLWGDGWVLSWSRFLSLYSLNPFGIKMGIYWSNVEMESVHREELLLNEVNLIFSQISFSSSAPLHCTLKIHGAYNKARCTYMCSHTKVADRQTAFCKDGLLHVLSTCSWIAVYVLWSVLCYMTVILHNYSTKHK